MPRVLKGESSSRKKQRVAAAPAPPPVVEPAPASETLGVNMPQADMGKKLVQLTQQFVNLMKVQESGVVDLNGAAARLGVQKRRIYDITNALEGVGILTKLGKNKVQWRGIVGGSAREVLVELENELAELAIEMNDMAFYLDTMSRDMQAIIFGGSEYNAYTFLTNEDLSLLPQFADKVIFAVNTPSPSFVNPQQWSSPGQPDVSAQGFTVTSAGPMRLLLAAAERTDSDDAIDVLPTINNLLTQSGLLHPPAATLVPGDGAPTPATMTAYAGGERARVLHEAFAVARKRAETYGHALVFDGMHLVMLSAEEFAAMEELFHRYIRAYKTDTNALTLLSDDIEDTLALGECEQEEVPLAQVLERPGLCSTEAVTVIPTSHANAEVAAAVDMLARDILGDDHCSAAAAEADQEEPTYFSHKHGSSTKVGDDTAVLPSSSSSSRYEPATPTLPSSADEVLLHSLAHLDAIDAMGRSMRDDSALDGNTDDGYEVPSLLHAPHTHPFGGMYTPVPGQLHHYYSMRDDAVIANRLPADPPVAESAAQAYSLAMQDAARMDDLDASLEGSLLDAQLQGRLLSAAAQGQHMDRLEAHTAGLDMFATHYAQMSPTNDSSDCVLEVLPQSHSMELVEMQHEDEDEDEFEYPRQPGRRYEYGDDGQLYEYVYVDEQGEEVCDGHYSSEDGCYYDASGYAYVHSQCMPEDEPEEELGSRVADVQGVIYNPNGTFYGPDSGVYCVVSGDTSDAPLGEEYFMNAADAVDDMYGMYTMNGDEDEESQPMRLLPPPVLGEVNVVAWPPTEVNGTRLGNADAVEAEEVGAMSGLPLP